MELIPPVLSTGWASGVNTYATVVPLGLSGGPASAVSAELALAIVAVLLVGGATLVFSLWRRIRLAWRRLRERWRGPDGNRA
jgi:hypothetical protein